MRVWGKRGQREPGVAPGVEEVGRSNRRVAGEDAE